MLATSTASTTQLQVAVGDDRGQVVLAFNVPTDRALISPPQASRIAEAIARAAFTAHHGFPPRTLTSELAIQAKERATEEVRIRLVTRCAHIVRSMMEKGRGPGLIAQECVDAVLKEVT